MAKALLEQYGVGFREVVLEGDVKSQFLNAYPNLRTVPQIFYGDDLIGGFTDLEKCVVDGRLEFESALVLVTANPDVLSAQDTFWETVEQTYPQQGK